MTSDVYDEFDPSTDTVIFQVLFADDHEVAATVYVGEDPAETALLVATTTGREVYLQRF